MTLLFFHAPWCTACRALEPLLESVTGADIEHIDCSVDVDTANEFSVTTLPLFVAVMGKDDHREIARIQTTSIPVLNNWVQTLHVEVA